MEYRIQVWDSSTDTPRTYPASARTLLGAKREAGQLARHGFRDGGAAVLGPDGATLYEVRRR